MTDGGADMPEIVELTLDQAGAALRDGRLTAETLVRRHLERIARFNAAYNAIIFDNPEALDEARAIDARLAQGEVLGPLAGIPVVVKDTMDMAGLPTTGGWSLLHGPSGGTTLMPERDSSVVARLRAAGAVILGKTNVPILSHTGSHANDSWAGPTINAHAPLHVPGGSSAGTATAVAASFAMVGLGEETGGSIQNPAAAQSLVGVKPTFGLVPTAGVMPLSGLRDVVGPIARCVRDAALMLDVLAGYTAEDPHTCAAIGHLPEGGYAGRLDDRALQGRRIGTYGPGWRDQSLEGETAELYSRALAELAEAGAVLRDDPFAGSGFAALRKPTCPPADYDGRGLESVPHDLDRYLRRMTADTAVRSFDALVAATAREDVFAPGAILGFLSTMAAFQASRKDPSRPVEQDEFVAARAAYLKIFNNVLDREGIDAVIFPQSRTALPGLYESRPIPETTVSEVNIAGLPAVTVPAGYYRSGAPFGLVIVGKQWSEADLLSYAYAYERHTGHRMAPVLHDGERLVAGG
ncbi:MAG: amidase [Gluconacetobacter sp.]